MCSKIRRTSQNAPRMPPRRCKNICCLLPPLSLLLLSGPSAATTIVAVRYGRGSSSGVVVGADTRTSSGGYVSNRFAAKLTFVLDGEADAFVDQPLETREDGTAEQQAAAADAAPSSSSASSSTCCVCRSGSAADTQALADAVRTDLLRRHLSQNRPGTVTAATRLLQNLVRSDPDLSASLICAGYDHVRGRSCIYSISPGGTAMEEATYAVQGSGSGYIYGYLEAGIQGDDGGNGRGGKDKDGRKSKVEEWDEDEAVEFVARVVGLAVERDGSSGGFCRIFAIDRCGKKEYTRVLHR